MGSSYSTESRVEEKPRRAQRKVNTKRLPVVEEVFVKEVAYKCGITRNEVDSKKNSYLEDVKKNPERGLEDFTNFYRDLRRNKPAKRREITHTVFRPEKPVQPVTRAMIVEAIKALGDAKGSSYQAIVKYMRQTYNTQDSKKVKLVLEKMREQKEVMMVGKNFKLNTSG